MTAQAWARPSTLIFPSIFKSQEKPSEYVPDVCCSADHRRGISAQYRICADSDAEVRQRRSARADRRVDALCVSGAILAPPSIEHGPRLCTFGLEA